VPIFYRELFNVQPTWHLVLKSLILMGMFVNLLKSGEVTTVCLAADGRPPPETFTKQIKRLQDGTVACLQVKIWFQNRRTKLRNSRERQLMTLGCTRDTAAAMICHVTHHVPVL